MSADNVTIHSISHREFTGRHISEHTTSIWAAVTSTQAGGSSHLLETPAPGEKERGDIFPSRNSRDSDLKSWKLMKQNVTNLRKNSKTKDQLKNTLKYKVYKLIKQKKTNLLWNIILYKIELREIHSCQLG